MTTRNFDALFQPRRIALLGASNRPGSVGAVLTRNLLDGGFPGALDFVNPRAEVIDGRTSFASIAALPATPDLAVIATPASTVPGLISELGARGCRAAVVITAGDAGFRKSVLNAAWPFGLRVMGPNCLGFLSPVCGINASFAQLTPKRGELALVTQSGAIATAMLDWAHGRGIGFSQVLSLGDMVDVDFGDALDYLALDSSTSAILLYVEQITHARKFMSAARIAARAKPVIVVKAGRSAGGAKAAQSHTGSLAGADNVYDAAFRRAGMLRVDALRDLFDAAQSLASGLRPSDSRLMIVTNGGGLGVLATDTLEQKGAQLAELSSAGREALNAVLPAGWSHANPVDIIGDASGARYAAALDIIAKETACDATLVMNCPTGVADNADCARAVADARVDGKPMLACWMGAASLEEPRRIFAAKGIPLYETPEDAVGAFVQLADFAHNQRALLETPAPTPDRPVEAVAKAQELIYAVLNDQRDLFSAAEAKELLALYGLEVAAARTAPDPAGAAREAAAIGGRLALKILSPDITHKSDVGGVALNLAPEDVQQAAEAMNARIKAKAPNARLAGFTIEAMIQRPRAQELLVGASVDPTFGPVIMFGHGGVAVEVIADTAIALPPLNSALARDLIRRTRVSRLLSGYRDRPAANLDAVCQALIAVSDLLANHPEIQELDINPLLADAGGAIAIDARVVVRRPSETDINRLAIAPYPAHIGQEIEIEGVSYSIRPLRPQDAPALLELGARTSASDIRLRFHGAVRVDDALGAARLSQLDYDREMALAAIDSAGAIAGVARVHFDPQIETGEFAILVRSDLQRHGLGRALLSALMDYARGRGAASITGDILPGNTAMLALANELGAEISLSAEATKRATFTLNSAAGG
ncbi:MAG: bifunctional acetate--CoA ligase family protein/GNAT family N-acetyltransferase [Hyphomonadaceae bacterium]|nr:bifunctional acetate--CoA ligase family protein/GNAT family N-acetyltransferase [Hyphomonadaceae bacterium]